MTTDFSKMTVSELKTALADRKRELDQIADALDKKAKATEAWRPGDRLEVGQDGGIRVVESADAERRMRESKVRAFRNLGLPQDAAERAADRGGTAA